MSARLKICPIWLAVCAVCAALIGPAASARSLGNVRSDTGDGERILREAIEAYGGLDAIKKHCETPRRLTLIRTYAKPTKSRAEFKVVTYGNDLKAIQKDEFGDQTIVHVGKTWWHACKGIAYLCSPTEITQQAIREKHSVYMLLEKANLASATVEGMQRINGMKCDQLMVKVEGVPKPVPIWIDRKRHLIRKVCWDSKGDRPPFELETVSEVLSGYERTDCTQGWTVSTDTVGRFEGRWKRIREQLLTADEVRKELAVPELVDTQYRVTVPFDDSGGRPVIQGQVNGHYLMKMLLDTGAFTSILNEAACELCEVPTGGKSAKRPCSPYFSFDLRPSTLRELKIGDSEFKNVPAAIASRGGRIATGLLGLDFLRQFCTTFDFDKRIVTFAGRLETPCSNAACIPLVVTRHAFVRATLNGKLVTWFAVDTGSGSTCLSSKALADVERDEPAVGAKEEREMRTRLDGSEQAIVQLPLSSLRIGDLVLEDVSAKHIQPKNSQPEPNLLGWNELRKFKSVTFDFAGEKMYLVPRKQEADAGKEREANLLIPAAAVEMRSDR